jgi:hypothetical protein
MDQMGMIVGSVEHGNENVSYMKNMEFFYHPSDFWFRRKDCTLWRWLVYVYLISCRTPAFMMTTE